MTGHSREVVDITSVYRYPSEKAYSFCMSFRVDRMFCVGRKTKNPIYEGSTEAQLAIGIGHMTETAGLL